MTRSSAAERAKAAKSDPEIDAMRSPRPECIGEVMLLVGRLFLGSFRLFARRESIESRRVIGGIRAKSHKVPIAFTGMGKQNAGQTRFSGTQEGFKPHIFEGVR